MKGRSITKAEERRFRLIQDNGCIVCLEFMGVFTPAEIHHIEGKTKPGAHKKTLGLCYFHHRAGNDCTEYTSRHPHKKRFEERYATEAELLAIQNQVIGSEEQEENEQVSGGGDIGIAYSGAQAT